MPLRVNLGWIVPGVITIVGGILVLFVWLIVVIVSYFMPVGEYTSLALLLIALGCFLAGIAQIFSGLSGWRSMRYRKRRSP